MLRRIIFPLLLGLPLAAQESQPTAPPAALQRELTVPLEDGRLHAPELLRALLDAYELDGSELRIPDVHLDLRGARGLMLLAFARKLLLDTVTFDRDLRGDELLVTIDRTRAREVRRELRVRLAQWIGRMTGEDIEARRYALDLPEPLDASRPLCVLVHGVESDAEALAELRAFLAAAPRNLQVATFAWPNDGAAEDAARELSGRLRALAPQEIALVGHSMGGLIARTVIEDPALDPGNVRTLVQIGTPNQGSRLAGFRFALEAADVLRKSGGDGAQHFARALLEAALDHWRDGLGEAGGDLLPDSVFLAQLATRPRNPRVDYHLVLGTKSVLSPLELTAVRAIVRTRLDGNTLATTVRPCILHWLDDLDELADGKGDGAVSVARGELEGIDPLLVPLDHVGLIHRKGVLGSVAEDEEHPVFAAVAQWVAEKK